MLFHGFCLINKNDIFQSSHVKEEAKHGQSCILYEYMNSRSILSTGSMLMRDFKNRPTLLAEICDFFVIRLNWKYGKPRRFVLDVILL